MSGVCVEENMLPACPAYHAFSDLILVHTLWGMAISTLYVLEMN